MFGLFSARIGMWAALAAAVLALGGFIYWQGGKSARMERDALQDQIDTGRRIDDAGEDIGGRDDDGILDWLHNRSQ